MASSPASRSRYWRAPSCGGARWPRSSCRPPSTVDGSALPSSRISRRGGGSTRRFWRAAATRALALAADGDPLVGARGRVSLLPHQLSTLERALAMDRVRLAICDEVGLGKTITAGAIFSEMKARGRLRRVVVVAPRGVQLQWIAEMADRFGEEFVRVGPEGLPVDSGVDPWRVFNQVVCSLDALSRFGGDRGGAPSRWRHTMRPGSGPCWTRAGTW